MSGAEVRQEFFGSDPRLLKLPAAARVQESAKLDLLMDLLPEQLARLGRVDPALLKPIVHRGESAQRDRVLLLADLKELSERTGELEAEIEELVADKARYEYELRDYEQTVAGFGY